MNLTSSVGRLRPSFAATADPQPQTREPEATTYNFEGQRAFDRFWRGRAGDGSGLGLAMARRLVEADGGTIELAAAQPHGLEAIVRLRPA